MKSKILIVEDEIIIAIDLKQRLESLGHDILDTALNGNDAIKKTRETNPDLVLMDIQLNGPIDGIEAAQQIQKLFKIPFIYLTGSHDNKIWERAQQTEPAGYITKPFDETEIQNAIELATLPKQD
ncbi:response regulator [Methanobacterium sp. VT]|uniref:Response regulator n=1 Tax=Methanobacterium spitsbergense TaxID=2874285 RepID=A0A8T5UVD8_9EURY|nr:response regulator [Methanobacterium spitsbergense]